jgi:hypothetical protein
MRKMNKVISKIIAKLNIHISFKETQYIVTVVSVALKWGM